MLWLTILFLLTTVTARPQFEVYENPIVDRHQNSVEEILKSLELFERSLRAEEEPPKHEKPRPLRFG